MKLVEASYKAENGNLWTSMMKYATLSYCLGQSLLIRTTRVTMEQSKIEVPWSRLCSTFRDGITVARRLGISWIWIDALCIVQHDEHDWEVEASMMFKYYTNAHITVMASSSPADAIPFLRLSVMVW